MHSCGQTCTLHASLELFNQSRQEKETRVGEDWRDSSHRNNFLHVLETTVFCFFLFMAFILLYQLLGNEIMAVIENSSAAENDEWEYYYDYLDPVIVDESKLKYNKCKSAL